MINLLVLKETVDSEKRVALVPDEIKKYLDLSFKVTIEKDAGIEAGFLNEDYRKQNADITQNVKKSIRESDIIIKIQKPCSCPYIFFNCYFKTKIRIFFNFIRY